MFNRKLYDRIISKLDIKGPGECWLYTGMIHPIGYGKIWIGKGRVQSVHRALMIAKYGPLGRWDFVCHHCDVRACANPSHLYIGNNQMNARDMAARGRHHCNRRTHCARGHEFSVENTYEHTDRNGWKHRKCRICMRENGKRNWPKYSQRLRAKRTSGPTGDSRA